MINADASELLQHFAELTHVPVIPTLMGWGCIPDDRELMAGMVVCKRRIVTATPRCWPPIWCSVLVTVLLTDTPVPVAKYTEGRKIIHIDIEPTQIGRVLCPDLGIVSDAKAALTLLIDVAQGDAESWTFTFAGIIVDECQQRKRTLLRKTHFDNVPVKPQRVYEEMNKAFGRDVCRYVTTIGLS